MSFILDALKKSEQARQVADIPELDYWVQATDPVKPVNWVLILLVFILLLNVMALAGWWFANAQSLGSFWTQNSATSEASVLSAQDKEARLPLTTPLVSNTPLPESQISESSMLVQPTVVKPAQWVVGTDTEVVKDVKDLGSQFDELGYEIIRPRSSFDQVALESRSSQHLMDETVPLMSDLPDLIRSEVPEFNVISHIYTQAAHRRSVIINQRRYRQGDEVGAGFILEIIESDHLVFSYMGTYFRHMVKL